MNLIERINQHLSQLSPHIKVRASTAMLIEARDEISKLQTKLQEEEMAKAEVNINKLDGNSTMIVSDQQDNTKNKIITVLNHGFVRLIDHMGSDLSIVRNARVSYNAEWRTGEDAGKDEKLIHYLIKNKHTSPFEAVSFTFEVKAPIFVFRQWHRHRTWSFNEISARYAELPEEFYVPDADKITTQSANNKQMRTDELLDNRFMVALAIESACAVSHDKYRELIKNGCPRELARGVLPVNTYSHMFATVDLHNLFHFLALRLHQHAQYEIRVYAEAMLKLIEPLVPVAVSAFRQYKLDSQ